MTEDRSAARAVGLTEAEADQSRHAMPFGAQVQADGSVRFRVWAPEAERLQLKLEGVSELLAMVDYGDGWHALWTDRARAGSRYRYVLPNGLQVPDPVSRFQPEDVNGPTEVVNPLAYRWTTPEWTGRPWAEAVLYELHVGTFTEEGTFRAAVGKLDHMVELGVTAIEIMSIGDFPGQRNWGYDGVLLYAPDSSYGRPEELKALVDAAHARGLMVILDVVYNHFGPEGNYLPQLFPDICTDRYATPWGQALNFDARHGERTREFIIHNALYWIEEFRMDGLRLDAVHAIIDASSTHVLDELAREVRAVAGDRHIHLILESDDTMWSRLIRDEDSTPLLSTAQWNHDSKQLQVLGLTSGRSLEQDRADTALLGRALVEGFTSQPAKVFSNGVHVAQPMTSLPQQVPPGAFIAFLQTHDLVGNRLMGERITQLAAEKIVRALAAVYLLSPQIPMLFMGEEWGASSPFPYFCDFHGELADAIRRGRLEQFTTAEERANPVFLATLPDPIAESTFLSAKLDWGEIAREPHARLLGFYRGILKKRREQIVPLLTRFPEGAGTFEVRGARSIEVRWRLPNGELRMDANLCHMASASFTALTGEDFWIEGEQIATDKLGAWSVRWSFDRGVTS